jgi:hypothetical protein
MHHRLARYARRRADGVIFVTFMLRKICVAGLIYGTMVL